MLAEEDNVAMEWIEIDPEAFTGTTVHIVTHIPVFEVKNTYRMHFFCVLIGQRMGNGLLSTGLLRRL